MQRFGIAGQLDCDDPESLVAVTAAGPLTRSNSAFNGLGPTRRIVSVIDEGASAGSEADNRDQTRAQPSPVNSAPARRRQTTTRGRECLINEIERNNLGQLAQVLHGKRARSTRNDRIRHCGLAEEHESWRTREPLHGSHPYHQPKRRGSHRRPNP